MTNSQFRCDYPSFAETSNDVNQQILRGKECYEVIAHAIEMNDPSLYRYQIYSQDRMVVMIEPTFSPVANFVVGTMVAGRSLAPFIAREFSKSYDSSAAAIGIVEDMIERIVAYNLQLFAERMCTPGFPSQDWSFDIPSTPAPAANASPESSAPPEGATFGWSEISPRELEVLKLVVKGRSNGEIAAELDIRQNTVKNHIGSLFDKLAVDNRTELAAVALKHGIL